MRWNLTTHLLYLYTESTSTHLKEISPLISLNIFAILVHDLHSDMFSPIISWLIVLRDRAEWTTELIKILLIHHSVRYWISNILSNAAKYPLDFIRIFWCAFSIFGIFVIIRVHLVSQINIRCSGNNIEAKEGRWGVRKKGNSNCTVR